MVLQAIHPFPIWAVLKNYQISFFKKDLFAAFSVALLALPQAMAYAFLADLPASAGIWSVVFGTIFTAVFGHSRLLVSGTTNMVAILIQSGTSEIFSNYYKGVSGLQKEFLILNIVLQLSLIIGIFQIFAGIFRLGRLTQFTSRSVIVGYILGAAAAIAVTQLFPLFGVSEPGEYRPIYQQALYFFSYFKTFDLATTIFGIGSLVMIIFLFRLSDKLPAAAIVFILATVLAAFFKLENIAVLKDIGFSPDLPKLGSFFLDVRVIAKLIPLAFAIMLLSILETTTIGRNYHGPKELLYEDNQEIFGLGISNFLSTFFGAMPSSGSFSRSALNAAAGAKTQLSAIFSGIFVFLFVAAFGFFVARIPIATLSALMIFTAYTMVNFRELSICLKASSADAFVVITTFCSSLVVTLDVALYIGIVLSIIFYLKHTAVPYLIEYSFNNYGKLRPLEGVDERLDPRIAIFQAEGELFFGAADLLQTKLRQICQDDSLQVIILQLFNIRYIDASACITLESICNYLYATKRHFLLTGIGEEVLQVLKKTEILKVIGERNCFAAKEQLPSEPTRLAYAFAKSLIA